ncbi:MAG: hypothetical protein HY866_13835, partial [Chloroflexi bacterium]|nr:hypothetical protein [Chloroflexota bacterium]
MRQKIMISLVLFACFFLVMTMIPASAQDNPPSSYKVVGYFIAWGIYDREYYVTAIPAELLTHINYAFANVSENGECILGDEWADIQIPYPTDAEDAPIKGNLNQLRLLKEKYPHLKTLLSVGGWTWSDRFSDAALTPESRAKFAASCVALVRQYGFDGLDVDWEYPTGGGLNPDAGRPEDTENFTLMLEELRRQFDAQGEQDGGIHYLLT